MPETSPSDAEIVERLKERARSISAASASMAASKTARNRATGDILAEYDFLRPEQTTEWKAAETITRLSARVEELERALSDAIEGWEEGAQYKGEYLRKKHGDAEGIAKARSLLSPSTKPCKQCNDTGFVYEDGSPARSVSLWPCHCRKE